MIVALVWIVVVVCVAALAFWVINQLTSDPMIHKVARIAIVVVSVLIIVGLAASIFGINTGLPGPQ